MLQQLLSDLKKAGDPIKAKFLAGFFKTGAGQYGEGDLFLGITVPQQRRITGKYTNIDLSDIQKLLSNKYHEARLTSLLILVERYKKADAKEKKKIVAFYLKNAKKINNWDLVDLTAANILGNYLLDKDREVLYKLANSRNLWERRISIVATYALIRNSEFKEILRLAKFFIKDKHDLIQKAVGWMLREVGKKNEEVLEKFLRKHYKTMPRTMLRYSIERLGTEKRLFYMAKKFVKI